MKRHAVLLLLAFTSSAQPATAPALVRVARIWDAGAHNAFTDLIRWRNRWYCTFREPDAHVGGDGRIRVLVSADGEAWTSAALIGEDRIDLRDPKLSITPDGPLDDRCGRLGLRGQALGEPAAEGDVLLRRKHLECSGAHPR
jgi:hypothetical protein